MSYYCCLIVLFAWSNELYFLVIVFYILFCWFLCISSYCFVHIYLLHFLFSFVINICITYLLLTTFIIIHSQLSIIVVLICYLSLICYQLLLSLSFSFYVLFFSLLLINTYLCIYLYFSFCSLYYYSLDISAIANLSFHSIINFIVYCHLSYHYCYFLLLLFSLLKFILSIISNYYVLVHVTIFIICSFLLFIIIICDYNFLCIVTHYCYSYYFLFDMYHCFSTY